MAATTAPTIAQSWARLVSFSKPHAPVSFGTRISVRISPAPIAVSRNPRWKFAAATSRLVPPAPLRTSVPPRARTTAGRSEAGSPWAMEPPMVPR